MSGNTTYIYENADWPKFDWQKDSIADQLAEVRHRQGRLIGRMETLGFALRSEAVLETLTQDVVTSSSIEGEILDREQVRSSIARRLGLDIGGLTHADRHVEGVVEMMLDATQHFDRILTAERLFSWQAALFPTGRSGMTAINVGGWRNDVSGPMQVGSGPIGNEKVHYQAPEAIRVPLEMTVFLEWLNSDSTLDLVLQAALAHLWFVTVHPFDDGNGRIARAITDMLLARSEGISRRFYSMSAQIKKDRKAYYDVLEKTQKGTLDITNWLQWFLECLSRAFDGAEITLDTVLKKARFFEKHAGARMNDRQRLMVNRLLDGFKGNLTSSKWAAITKCSQDTAHRDIINLIQQGILVKDLSGGRSTAYSLVI